jgi:hypothetical protein
MITLLKVRRLKNVVGCCAGSHRLSNVVLRIGQMCRMSRIAPGHLSLAVVVVFSGHFLAEALHLLPMLKKGLGNCFAHYLLVVAIRLAPRKVASSTDGPLSTATVLMMAE